MIHMPNYKPKFEEFVPEEASNEGVDVLKETLRSIGSIPMLTLDQEQTLAREIRDAKQDYRRELLSHAPTLALVVETLNDTLAGKERLDRVASVNMSNATEKNRALAIFRINSVTLAAISQRCQAEDRKRLSARLANRVLRLVDETSLHTTRIEAAAVVAGSDGCDECNTARARYETLRNKMVSANLRLAVSVAKRYQQPGYPILDLIQEGSEGLMRAAEKFEPDRGFKFSTYAVWWIRQRIRAAVIEKSRVIRVGETTLSRIRSLTEKAAMERGVDIGNVSVEDVLQQSPATIKTDELRRTFYASREVLSLDRPITDQSNSSQADMIEADMIDVEAVVDLGFHRETIRSAMNALSDREKAVVTLRFGLNDGQARNLAEVGRILQCSRERVRQLEKSSLSKLRDRIHEN